MAIFSMMKLRSISFLVLCLLLLCCRGDKKQDADKKSTFKPTDEWQTVEEGDILPSGLHYRMNLQTGKKEAKLIDLNSNEEDKGTSLTYDKDKQETIVDDKVAESIKKIDDETRQAPDARTIDPSDEDKLKQLIKGEKNKEEFRNYEELKSIFEEMNMTVETDIEIMNKLFQSFDLPSGETENVNVEDDVISYLKDFEYLVSQIDNARHFVHQNGITKIILPCLNSSSFEIKTEALKLLGSAVQNNVPVQIKSLEQNILQPILHLFDQHVISKEHIKAGNELDHVYRLKSAAIYAISCLIRNFPTAQNDFIKNGGLDILLNEKIFLNNCENGYKLQLKIASLINTLLQERYDAQISLNIHLSKLQELNSSVSPDHQSAYELNLTRSQYLTARSKLDQYNERDLHQSLANLHWCNIAKQLFIKNNYKANMETVSEILLTNLKLCDNFRHDKQLRNILINLNHQLQDYDEQAALNLQQLYEVFVKQGTIEEVVVKDRTIEEVVVKDRTIKKVVVKDRTIEEEGVKQETEEERYVKDEL